MHPHKYTVKKVIAYSLLIFPSILIIAFTMHIQSISYLLDFKLQRPAYNADQLFDALVQTKGGNFLHAHVLAYCCVPFMILTILSLGYIIYSKKPVWAVWGVGTGITGAVCMAGFFAIWISFSAIARVEPQNYAGAKAALVELTRMAGALKVITLLSFLSLLGMVILGIGLFRTKQLPAWSPVCIIVSCVLIGVFWGLPNWMLIGAAFMLIGLIPASKYFKTNSFI